MNQNQIQKQQQENTEVQYPPTTEIMYPYSVRIEQSAKGARISVHCYNSRTYFTQGYQCKTGQNYCIIDRAKATTTKAAIAKMIYITGKKVKEPNI